MSVDTKTLDAAVEHHQNGELAAAVEIYQEILNADPDNADAWHLMGVFIKKSAPLSHQWKFQNILHR